ncbi:MAG: hypothetical protein ACXABY_09640 [Candidatus Thorarchaeota archaeon]|jgi:hypothetical protein
MKLSEENDTMFGNRYLISDHGYATLVKLEDGTIGCEGFSIARAGLTQEERDMHDKPEEMWEEFFRQQSTLDEE